MSGAGWGADRAGEGVVEPEAAVAQAAVARHGAVSATTRTALPRNTARGYGLEGGRAPPVVPARRGLDARGPEDAILHQVAPR